MPKECPAKHTVFQPTDEQWRCPGCGADNSDFIIDESDKAGAANCVLVHQVDEIVCSACGYYGSGKTATQAIAKKLSLVKCPTCKGHGVVAGDGA